MLYIFALLKIFHEWGQNLYNLQSVYSFHGNKVETWANVNNTKVKKKKKAKSAIFLTPFSRGEGDCTIRLQF